MSRPNGIPPRYATAKSSHLASANVPRATPCELQTGADADEILNLKDAARVLGFSESHLSKVLAGKFPNLPKLPHVRVGRTVRLRRSAVLEWFRQAENSNQAPDWP